jgi:hypothetical protein
MEGDIISYRYLIKHDGNWTFYSTRSMSPLWNDNVTDVIWLKSPDMVANWWRMKDGKKLNLGELVKDDELSLILLQAQR